MKINQKATTTGVLAVLVAVVAGLFVVGVRYQNEFTMYVTGMGSILSVIGAVFTNHVTNSSTLTETKAQTPSIDTIKNQTNGVIAAQFSAVHQKIDSLVATIESVVSPVTEALHITDPLTPEPASTEPPVTTGTPSTPVPATPPPPVATPTPAATPTEPTPVSEPVLATPQPVIPSPQPVIPSPQTVEEPKPIVTTPPVATTPATEPKPVTPTEIPKKNSVIGIDVASYQGVDFSTEGLSFGYAKRSQGTSYLNEWWAAQIEKFRRASMLCGHYLFLEPGNDTNIVEQVNYFLKNLTYKTGEDLILVDWETAGCTEAMRDKALHTLMPHFVHNRVGTYCNLNFWLHIDTESYPGDFLFIADPSAPEGEPRIHYSWKFDQYSSVGGLDHDVASFTTKETMLEWAHGKK